MRKFNVILKTALILGFLYSNTFLCLANSDHPNNSNTSIKTFTGDFDQALKHASANGKLLLVDFYADWCTPCRWMDKTTFSDPNIAYKLNENYIFYKADIDNPIGYNEKEKFHVKVLPTILIFNTKGEIQERIEETMTPEELLPILNFHDHPNNTLRITHSINKSPEKKSNHAFSSNQDLQILYEEYKRKEKVKSNYRLQIGIYDDYKVAFQRVSELRNTFLEEIIVLNDFQNGIAVYKVMMGQFSTQNEANSFREILINHYNIDAIVH